MTKKNLAIQTLSIPALDTAPALIGVTGTQCIASASVHGVRITLPAGYLVLPALPDGRRLALMWKKAAGATNAPAATYDTGIQ